MKREGPNHQGPTPRIDPVERTLAAPGNYVDALAAIRAEVHRQLERQRRDRERARDHYALCVANFGRWACRCTSRGSGMSCPYEGEGSL
jgi:hypothetical protein